MTSAFFSMSLALRSTGLPSLAPASLAGPSDDHSFDDLLPIVHDDDRREPDIAGLD